MAPKKPPKPPDLRVVTPKSAKMARAMDMLLTGMPIQAVAAELGVDRKQVYRWREDPVFDEEFLRRQQELSDAVHAKLMDGFLGSIDALFRIATNTDTFPEKDEDTGEVSEKRLNHPAMARVNAIRAIGELLGKHKNAPVAPSEKGADPETAEQVLEVLRAFPAPLLEQALAEKKKPRRGGGEAA